MGHTLEFSWDIMGCTPPVSSNAWEISDFVEELKFLNQKNKFTMSKCSTTRRLGNFVV